MDTDNETPEQIQQNDQLQMNPQINMKPQMMMQTEPQMMMQTEPQMMMQTQMQQPQLNQPQQMMMQPQMETIQQPQMMMQPQIQQPQMMQPQMQQPQMTHQPMSIPITQIPQPVIQQQLVVDHKKEKKRKTQFALTAACCGVWVCVIFFVLCCLSPLFLSIILGTTEPIKNPSLNRTENANITSTEEEYLSAGDSILIYAFLFYLLPICICICICAITVIICFFVFSFIVVGGQQYESLKDTDFGELLANWLGFKDCDIDLCECIPEDQQNLIIFMLCLFPCLLPVGFLCWYINK